MRPFSISRWRTSWMSNFLYCASRTPSAMFSKSMKSASRCSTADRAGGPEDTFVEAAAGA
jgi:hypothetical protein